MGNTFKTAFLLTALTLLLMFIGRAFGGQNGMFLALAFGIELGPSSACADAVTLVLVRAWDAPLRRGCGHNNTNGQ